MDKNLHNQDEGRLSLLLGELEGCLNEALKEVRRLRNRARTLEEENQRLRAFMFSSMEDEGGRQKLLRFYQDGFHVCPPQFARVRSSEGCLFCQSFLEKKGVYPDG